MVRGSQLCQLFQVCSSGSSRRIISRAISIFVATIMRPALVNPVREGACKKY